MVKTLIKLLAIIGTSSLLATIIAGNILWAAFMGALTLACLGLSVFFSLPMPTAIKQAMGETLGYAVNHG